MRLIDKDALLEIMPTIEDEYKHARELIENAPTIEERKTGRWKHYGEESWLRDDGTPVFLQCSRCGAVVLNNGCPSWNYCGVCGAKMEGTV